MSTIPAAADLRRRRIAAVMMLAAIAAGIGIWRWYSDSVLPQPPAPAEETMEPAVAALVKRARDRTVQNPRSAAAWGELGEVFFANELEDEALICFQRADQLDPSSDSWPSLVAVILINRGDRDEAAKFLERAIANGRGESSLVRRMVLAEQLLLLGRNAEAESRLGEVAARKPEDARLLFDSALLAIAQQDFAKARTLLEPCLESRFSKKKSRVQLAAVCRRLGDSEAAARFQKEADRLPPDPSWPDPVVERYSKHTVKKAAALKQSDELVAQGRFVDALRQFAPRAADFPEDDVVQMTLGRLLAQTGDLAGGETAFRRAIELAPHKIQSHYYLSYFLVAKGTNLAESGNPSKAEAAFKEAETCARRALGLKPDYGFAYNSLGLALKKQKRFEEAEKAMREAVRCIPDMAEIRIDLADILADENRPADAIEQYEQALKLAPPDASWRPEVEKKRDALRKGK